MAEPSPGGELALMFLQERPDPTKSSPGLTAQMSHRLQIVSFFGIAPGSRILELGCGQGDTTIALAHAVGPTGHIDAIDPGSPDYGTPPLKDAQAHILSSPLGPRIKFHNAFPVPYLASYTGPPYDYVVLAHSIWYFSTPSVLPELIFALSPHLHPANQNNPKPKPKAEEERERGGGTKLCIAEWSLTSSSPNSIPHVWTALLRSLLESKRPTPSSANIRTVLSPSQIKKIITTSPSPSSSSSPSSCPSSSSSIPTTTLHLLKETTQRTETKMQDGYWEVSYVLRKREADIKRLRENGVEEREVVQVEAYYDALEMSVEGIDGVEGVECMDWWGGIFGV